MQKNDSVKIYSGTRAWYELVLAAIFYSVTIYILLDLFYTIIINFNGSSTIQKLFNFLYYGMPCLANALFFSITKDIEIDIHSKIITSIYKVGPFYKTKKTKALQFEYISIFHDSKQNFQTNLWYKGNRFYKMYDFEKIELAIPLFITKVPES